MTKLHITILSPTQAFLNGQSPLFPVKSHDEQEFAKALGIPYKESLLKAFKHYQKALEINPNNPDYHNNLAILYTNQEFAKDNEQYCQHIELAFWEMIKAFYLDPTPDRYDRFFRVITQIPDDLAQEVFNHLSEKTRKMILKMYSYILFFFYIINLLLLVLALNQINFGKFLEKTL